MRRLLIGGLLIGFMAAPPAMAQDKTQDAGSPQALEAARELTAIMSPEIVQQLSAAIMEPVFKNLEVQFAGKLSREALRELRSEFENITSRFTNEVMTDAPALYARHFSAQELREIVAFYRTPTGAKSLHIMPKLSGELFATMMPRMAALQRELETVTQRVLSRHGQGGK